MKHHENMETYMIAVYGSTMTNGSLKKIWKRIILELKQIWVLSEATWSKNRNYICSNRSKLKHFSLNANQIYT